MKNINHKLCQFIIKKYVKGNINWPREIKIAQKLIKKFKEFEFWYNLKDLVNPPPSLAWFLKPQGKIFLLQEYERFKLNLVKEQVALKDEKVSQDKIIIKKPKTLISFLKK